MILQDMNSVHFHAKLKTFVYIYCGTAVRLHRNYTLCCSAEQALALSENVIFAMYLNEPSNSC